MKLLPTPEAIKTGLAVVLLAISCTKDSVQNPSNVSSQSRNNSVSAHYLGEYYGGGVIFYIDTSGEHGLIAAEIDLGHLNWSDGIHIVTGATAAGLGKGQANTIKIISAQGTPGKYAALKCARYKGGGYTDWFLPSQKELNLLYHKKEFVPNLEINFYWCSTEINSTSAWVEYFYNGKMDDLDKAYPAFVRAIRHF